MCLKYAFYSNTPCSLAPHMIVTIGGQPEQTFTAPTLRNNGTADGFSR